MPYEKKFAMFMKALAADVDAVLITELWVIGDTPDEISESLRRLAASGKQLVVAVPGLTLSVALDEAASRAPKLTQPRK